MFSGMIFLDDYAAALVEFELEVVACGFALPLLVSYRHFSCSDSPPVLFISLKATFGTTVLFLTALHDLC